MGSKPSKANIDKTIQMNDDNGDKTPTNDPVNAVPPKDTAQLEKDLQSALAQKEHFREKAERAEAERKAIEERLSQTPTNPEKKVALDVGDYINISASLDGLDPREKAYLAEQHTQTGRPLKDIREGEDFQLWQTAYRAKLEKERALTPNTTQDLEERPSTLNDRLRQARTIAEKETILREAGLYKDPRTKADRVRLG
jgi:hypothetical protein